MASAVLSKPYDNRFDVFTSNFTGVEISDDSTRAVLTIPLMHVGPNKKGLYWTEKMLREVADMFRGVVFKYDIQGQEGSSHVLKKLFSPFYDVGWVYDGTEGAWYDHKTKTLWVKGEVTHPEVVEKLKRENSKGKRELNYASMGVMVSEAKCSICGHESGECDHERNKRYDEGTCYSVPTKIAKALHVALTNDPADGEAEIQKCVFQELGADDYRMSGNKFENQKAVNKIKDVQNINDKVVNDMNNATDPYSTGNQTRPDNMHEQMGVPSEVESNQMLQNQMPNGMAPGMNQTGHPGEAPSPEHVLRALAERIKTLEQKIDTQGMATPAPELVNSAPQDQMTQDNMGVTTQMEQQPEADNMDLSKGQNTQEKTAVNPPAVETQDGEMNGGDSMQQIMNMLQQILQRLPQVATQDVGELIETDKNKAKKAQDDVPTEHVKSPVAGGEASSGKESISDDTHESNKKNVANMRKPDMVATADDSKIEALTTEVADLKSQIEKMSGSMEFADNQIPEFGGNATQGAVEVADMTAEQRRQQFGEYGAFDSIFNGANSAQRFKK